MPTFRQILHLFFLRFLLTSLAIDSLIMPIGYDKEIISSVKAIKMTLQFQNQTDLQEFLKHVEKQSFTNLKKLTVKMEYDEAVIELAINAYNATIINPRNSNNTELL